LKRLLSWDKRMRPHLGLLCVALAGVLSSFPACAANVEAIETARPGETEEMVCARARQQARIKSEEVVLETLQNQPEYLQLVDKAHWRGDSQAQLDVALTKALSATIEMIDMGEMWSGRSCLYRGMADADIASVMDDFHARYERQVPVAVEAERADAGQSLEPAVVGIDKLRKASLLHSAVAQLSVIKITVTQYRMTEDKWPGSLAELGFQASDLAGAGSIHDVTLGRDGTINARLKGELSGHDVRLIPDKASFGGLSWRCETSVEMLASSACKGP
jgi:hypothetical protein